MSSTNQPTKMNFALKEVKLEPSELTEEYQCAPPPALTPNYPIVQFNYKIDPNECITEGDGNNPFDQSVNVSFDRSRHIKSEIDTTTGGSSSSADATAAFYAERTRNSVQNPEIPPTPPGFSNTIENDAIFYDEHHFQSVLQKFEEETCQPFAIGSSTKNTDLATDIEIPGFPRKSVVYKCIRGGKRRYRGKGIRQIKTSLAIDCPAHFRVNLQPDTNILKITTCQLEHNHGLTPDLLLLGKKGKARKAHAASDPGGSVAIDRLSMEELTCAQERAKLTLVIAAVKTPKIPLAEVFPAPPIQATPSINHGKLLQTSDRIFDENQENIQPVDDFDSLAFTTNVFENWTPDESVNTLVHHLRILTNYIAQ